MGSARFASRSVFHRQPGKETMSRAQSRIPESLAPAMAMRSGRIAKKSSAPRAPSFARGQCLARAKRHGAEVLFAAQVGIESGDLDDGTHPRRQPWELSRHIHP